MANEITVVAGLTIKAGNLSRSGATRTFRADMDTTNPAGPSPGAVLVDTDGTDIDFSQLINPGWCQLTNLENDGGSDIEYGVYDPELNRFYAWWILKPGQTVPMQFSPQFQWQTYPVVGVGATTGTGTGGSTNRFRVRATAHACYALVEAFTR